MIEVLECGYDFRLVEDEENPSKAGAVINEGNKPPFIRGGSELGRSSNITMDKNERLSWLIWL